MAFVPLPSSRLPSSDSPTSPSRAARTSRPPGSDVVGPERQSSVASKKKNDSSLRRRRGHQHRAWPLAATASPSCDGYAGPASVAPRAVADEDGPRAIGPCPAGAAHGGRPHRRTPLPPRQSSRRGPAPRCSQRARIRGRPGGRRVRRDRPGGARRLRGRCCREAGLRLCSLRPSRSREGGPRTASPGSRRRRA